MAAVPDTLGFEIRTVGANPEAARYAGMRPRRLIMLTMSICRSAGRAGRRASRSWASTHKTPAASATKVGFDAIAVALLGRSNPIGIILAALLFGAMRAGAGLMQIEAGIPPELVDVLQAIDPALPRRRAGPRDGVFRCGRRAAASGSARRSRSTYGGQARRSPDGPAPVRHPAPRAHLPVRRLPDRDPADHAPIILRAATPLALGALCGVMCERSGVVNIGIEGRCSPRPSSAGSSAIARWRPSSAGPSVVFGITPALLIGARSPASCGRARARCVHAWLSISFRADQIISGTIINIAAFGITGYLNTLISPRRPTERRPVRRVHPPDVR